MLPANRWAFKEWAAICDALAAGRQSLILRKGGLHEGREGFRVDHPEFWLYPTNFHQRPEQLTAAEAAHWQAATCESPPAGTIALSLYAVVERVQHLTDAGQLNSLTGRHGWSEQTVDERFHYRQPGLFALVVRVYRRPEPWRLVESPRFAGCRSWVDLGRDLPTDGCRPVLSDAEHRERMTDWPQLPAK
uniref:DUF1802 family protein n=1 Tax=Schlesneria paludicola TaxID=360056 RepID=A0A7C2JZQ9_9PLAN